MTTDAVFTVGSGVEKQRRDRLSNYFRARRFPLIVSMIENIHRQTGRCRIVDIGGRQEYWDPILPVLAKCNAHITVINLEKTQPQCGMLFDFEFGNACDLSKFGDRAFDLAHSNSLLEHVGNWGHMRAAANEMRRVASAYYVQTPYFWFPLEPHFRVPFYHWMPEQLRCAMNMRWKLGYIGKATTLDHAMANVQSAALLDKRQFQALFPDAEVQFERVLGLPKSLIAHRPG